MSETIIAQTTVKDTRLTQVVQQEWNDDTILGYIKERRVPEAEFDGKPSGAYLLMEAFDANGELVAGSFEDAHRIDRHTPIGSTFPGEDGITHVLIGVFHVWRVEDDHVVLVNSSHIGCPVHEWCDGHTVPNTSFDEIRGEVHMSKETIIPLGFDDATAHLNREQRKNEPEKVGVSIGIEGTFDVSELRKLAIELDKLAGTVIATGSELLARRTAVDPLDVIEIVDRFHKDSENGLYHLFTRSEDDKTHAVPQSSWNHLDTETERNPKPGDTWYSDPFENGDTSSQSTYVGLYRLEVATKRSDGMTVATFRKEAI